MEQKEKATEDVKVRKFWDMLQSVNQENKQEEIIQKLILSLNWRTGQ